MSNRVFLVSVFLFLAIAISAIIVHAQDQDEVQDGGVKSHGVIHNIAEDRKVERIGGIYEPEGLDKYMKRKFDAMSEKIDSLEAKVDQLTQEVQKIAANKRRPSPGTLISGQPAP